MHTPASVRTPWSRAPRSRWRAGRRRNVTPPHARQRDETDDRDEPWTADEGLPSSATRVIGPSRAARRSMGLPELAELIQWAREGPPRTTAADPGQRRGRAGPAARAFAFEAPDACREAVHDGPERGGGEEPGPGVDDQLRHGRSKRRERAHARVERGHRAHRLPQRQRRPSTSGRAPPPTPSARAASSTPCSAGTSMLVPAVDSLNRLRITRNRGRAATDGLGVPLDGAPGGAHRKSRRDRHPPASRHVSLSCRGISAF